MAENLNKLTDSTDNAVFVVSWFPADQRMLYTYDGGGNELNHVYLREEDGSTRDLTPGEELKASFLAWSQDGESFYLTTTERNQQAFDVYRYSASDYSREMVYENPRVPDLRHLGGRPLACTGQAANQRRFRCIRG